MNLAGLNMMIPFLKKYFQDAAPACLSQEEVKARNKALELLITTVAMKRSLLFRAPPKKLAVISGAGIAGLAASFELLARGFNVVIGEMRNTFDRFNVINVDVEAQRFLKKFGMLNEFEQNVAGRISTHNYVLLNGNSAQHLATSDVSELATSQLPFEPEVFPELFNEDALYSVRIKDLQTFLANKALDAGVRILGNVKTEVIARTRTGRASSVELTGKNNIWDHKYNPCFLFIAEGAHSRTAKQLGFNTNEVKNECTGENWVFGNVKYSGKKTFVISVIDITNASLVIANIIFNAKIGEINIAVTAKKSLSPELIQERILKLMERIAPFQKNLGLPTSLLAAVKRPVRIRNMKRVAYSQGNVFMIGDAAGYSSPLAGMGGTLGLTLIPQTVLQLINDSEQQPQLAHLNFHRYTDAYVSRWMSKSQRVKKHCLGFFKNKACVSAEQERVVTENCDIKRINGVSQ